MRELHLHIGLHKTGTTHLQVGLKANEAALAAAGFSMGPLQDRRGGHHDLARLLKSDGPERCVEVLREAPGERLIISSELFCWLFLDPAVVGTFAEHARKDFSIKAYIWLRRQDFLGDSYQAEEVKINKRAKISGTLSYHLSFDERLSILEAAFGPAALLVRLYRDDRRSDTFTEFLDLLGVDPSAMEMPGPQNLSPSRRETLLLSRVPKSDHFLNHLILSTLLATHRVANDGERFLLSPAARRALLEPLLPANREIAARHGFEDAEWFWSPPPDDADWTPPRPITLSEYAALWADCVRRVVLWRGRPRGLKRAAALTSMFLRAAFTPPA